MQFVCKMLSKLAEKHNLWIKVARKLGAGDEAEDVVQDMYLKLYKYVDEKKIIKNDVINNFYVHLALKTIIIENFNKRKNFIRLDSPDFKDLPFNDTMPEELDYAKVLNIVDTEIENWNWYEKNLFNLYKNTNLSIKKLASELDINRGSLYHTIKKCKNKILCKRGLVILSKK